ncbi:hypothetical protein [Clostridium sp. OS1-26]|uniref:hypothetical protein n=1 Tax=Clostridium sp. OS1-26 TaxID=3070681 RepID=UPI0027DEF414|nr:hypothetical protein [Clostridium sp. OS1-26]WML33994.1 hypothetical protein RCG18_22150 [Clostridium sp. OS1-26]
MKVLVNFYLLSEDVDDSYEDLVEGIEADNPIYLSLQTGDVVVLPGNNDLEFVISKIVKNLSNQQMDVYVSKLKGAEEIFDELESFASKTLQTMFGSIKASIDDIGKDKAEDKKGIYLKEIKFKELDENN